MNDVCVICGKEDVSDLGTQVCPRCKDPSAIFAVPSSSDVLYFEDTISIVHLCPKCKSTLNFRISKNLWREFC